MTIKGSFLKQFPYPEIPGVELWVVFGKKTTHVLDEDRFKKKKRFYLLDREYEQEREHEQGKGQRKGKDRERGRSRFGAEQGAQSGTRFQDPGIRT